MKAHAEDLETDYLVVGAGAAGEVLDRGRQRYTARPAAVDSTVAAAPPPP